MKKIIFIIVGIAIGIAGTMWFLRRNGETESAEKAPRAEAAKEKEASAPPASPGTVNLDRAQQTVMGIATTNPVMRDVPRELKGFGRVIDPTPLASALAEIETAQAALDASRKEYERSKALFAHDQNLSARALETAEAAMKRDRVALDSARAKLVAQWGRALVERSDLATLVDSLIHAESALVRIDVGLSEPVFSAPTGARIVSLVDESRSVDGEFLGFATMADAQVQGQGFLFLVKANALALRPDMAVIGYLQLSGEPAHGVVIPHSAVLRDRGEAWVYVLKDDTTFVRKEVPLDHPLDSGWFVGDALAASDRVVTSGAQVLFAEEQKAKLKLAD